MNRLLSLIYRPHNVYCIHVDSKSSLHMREAVANMVGCLDNVFVPRRVETIIYAGYSRLQADINCMQDHVINYGKVKFVQYSSCMPYARWTTLPYVVMYVHTLYWIVGSVQWVVYSVMSIVVRDSGSWNEMLYSVFYLKTYIFWNVCGMMIYGVVCCNVAHVQYHMSKCETWSGILLYGVYSVVKSNLKSVILNIITTPYTTKSPEHIHNNTKFY